MQQQAQQLLMSTYDPEVILSSSRDLLAVANQHSSTLLELLTLPLLRLPLLLPLLQQQTLQTHCLMT
jgi:hypothetical protein